MARGPHRGTKPSQNTRKFVKNGPSAEDVSRSSSRRRGGSGWHRVLHNLDRTHPALVDQRHYGRLHIDLRPLRVFGGRRPAFIPARRDGVRGAGERHARNNPAPARYMRPAILAQRPGVAKRPKLSAGCSPAPIAARGRPGPRARSKLWRRLVGTSRRTSRRNKPRAARTVPGARQAAIRWVAAPLSATPRAGLFFIQHAYIYRRQTPHAGQ